MLLLLLSLCIPCSAHNPEYSTVLAEGSISMPCGFYSTHPASLVVKLQMEESSNDSWVVVGMTSSIVMLATNFPSLLVTSKVNENTFRSYSCSVDNITSNASRIEHTDNGLNNMVVESGEKEWIDCKTPKSWTVLQWFRGREVIAVVERVEIGLNILVERNGSSSFLITSTINETIIKTLNVTCQWRTLPNLGWQQFMEGKYWIILIVALSSVLFCVTLMGCFVSIKRRRRARRQAKNSRFFKVSTATRNLYTDSITQDTDVAQKNQDFTYQNVSLSPTKVISDDCFSDKSSFLSLGGDSYLEPNADEEDKVSDGDCYEDPTEEQDEHEESLDGDCYENADEEIKDGSEGSQSYEDMKGSICIRTKTEAPPDEGITQDEDADSYENMQTPLYSPPNRPCNPQYKSFEDQTEGDPTAQQQPWKVTTELNEQNGDFYLSYESNKQ